MRIGKKKESLLGLIITAVLCLGFLWFWFRPEPQHKTWEEHDAVRLVKRAEEEAKPGSKVERQMLDLDVLEIAFSQVREHRKDDALAVAKYIDDAVIRTLAARELAQSYLSADAKDRGEVLEFTVLAPNDQQAAVRAEILGMLAMTGYPDAAIPEAKTPLQKATLATRITEADDKVRELVAGAEAGLASLPAAEALAVRRAIAHAKVMLARSGPLEGAMAAVKALPVEERGKLWGDLAGVCQGRTDYEETVPLVFKQVEDAGVRRRMEIESLIFGVKVREAAEIIADCEGDVKAAATPEAKVAAMLTLSRAQYDGGGDELKTAAGETMKRAMETAKGIGQAGARCRALLSLARRFSDVVQLDDSRAALTEAIAAARAVEPAAERIPLLVEAEDESRKQADEPGAVKLMEEAAGLLEKSTAVPDATTVEMIASALVRRGHWARGLALVERLPDGPVRAATLEAVVKTAAEDFASVDPANPPPRGEPYDKIRKAAISDQVEAANLTEAQPGGFARARGWLAMAKGVFTAPMSLNDYMAGGEGVTGDGDGAGEEEGPQGEEK